MNEKKGLTIGEKIEALGGSMNELKIFLSKEIPDTKTFNDYPGGAYHDMTKAIYGVFGEAGIEMLQVHNECIMHGGK
jgi:hypothetical protein